MEHISLEEVRHVARLARLALSEDEVAILAVELSALLDHVDKVRRLDTAGIPPTAHPLPLSNVLRADEPRPCLDRDLVLAAAPAVEDDRFQVPAILAEEPRVGAGAEGEGWAAGCRPARRRGGGGGGGGPIRRGDRRRGAGGGTRAGRAGTSRRCTASTS